MTALAGPASNSQSSPKPSGDPPGKQAISNPLQEKLKKVVSAASAMTPALAETVSRFWGMPVAVSFLSASPKNHYFWRMDDFYVSQLPLDDDGEKIAQLRLSDIACSELLSKVLGDRESAFRISGMSNFEAHLLTHFTTDLFGALVRQLVKRRLPEKKAGGKKSPLIHLIWVLRLDEKNISADNLGKTPGDTVGKIVLSVPLNALRLDSSQPEMPPDTETGSPLLLPAYSESFFADAHVTARVLVGKAKLRIEEMKQLEPDDIVVLDDSHSSRLFLIEETTGNTFAFQPDIPQAEHFEVPYTQEIAMMEEQHNTTIQDKLWDNLMINVNAEFMPTPIPLNQLKQMSEGLIVEVGDLVNNRIRLHVEGKTFATGELVIVGDKFGVRIDAVEGGQSFDHASSDTSRKALGASAGMATAPPMPSAQAAQQLADAGATETASGENSDDWMDNDFDDFDDEEEDW